MRDHQLTAPGMQMLPQEVAEQIFDALDGDVATLSSCILVSRIWAALAYPVRFRRIAFSTHAAVVEKNIDPRAFEDFLNLLHQSRRLCQCIQELCLRSESSVGILDTATLQSIISRLPFLAALELAVPHLYLSQIAQEVPMLPARLRKLTIGSDCLWMSQESLAGLLGLFDEIDELTHFVSTMPMESKPGFTVSRPSSNKLEVKSLTFIHGARPVMTKAVEGCLSVYSQLLGSSCLTSFAVDPGNLSSDELKSYGRFVGEFGKSVRHFRCGVFRRTMAVEGIDIISHIPADVQPGVLTAQFAAGLEFSWWFQRVVTCGWDSAVRGLLRAPSSVRTLRLTLETSERFFTTFEGSCVAPQEGLLKLLETLEWSAVERVIESHQTLETLQVELEAAACTYSDSEKETFQQECAEAVLSRLTNNARVRKSLRVIVI